MGDLSEKTGPSSATVHDDVPDEVLELVFLRLPSSLHLIRAACTCKRWRLVVADGSFLRRFRDLHPRPVVAGRYRVDVANKYMRCPPGHNPVFSHSPLDLRPQHLSLDFLSTYDHGCWDLADSRRGILLLYDRTVPMALQLRHLVVCDPTTRRCSSVIAPPPFLDNQLLGAFLLDSDADEDGVYISLTKFRIIVVLYDNGGIVRSCVFTSSNSNGGDWSLATSMAVTALRRSPGGIFFAGHVAECVYWTTICEELLVLDKDAAELKMSSLLPDNVAYSCYVMTSKSGIVRCEDGALRIACLDQTHLEVFIQVEHSDGWVWEKSIPRVQLDGSEYRVHRIFPVEEGSIILGTLEGIGVVSVNLATMELKRAPHDEVWSHEPAHMYHLPWPPTIRACLP